MRCYFQKMTFIAKKNNNYKVRICNFQNKTIFSHTTPIMYSYQINKKEIQYKKTDIIKT